MKNGNRSEEDCDMLGIFGKERLFVVVVVEIALFFGPTLTIFAVFRSITPCLVEVHCS